LLRHGSRPTVERPSPFAKGPAPIACDVRIEQIAALSCYHHNVAGLIYINAAIHRADECKQTYGGAQCSPVLIIAAP
jgi:hypothetical protein